MARVKGALNAKKKHNRVLKLAKGYRGARSKQYRIAKQSVVRALNTAFAGRKQKKRPRLGIRHCFDYEESVVCNFERFFLPNIGTNNDKRLIRSVDTPFLFVRTNNQLPVPVLAGFSVNRLWPVR